MHKVKAPIAISRILYFAKHFYRLYVRRDPFLLEVRRWFRAKGDETLRLDYPLDAESMVVDVGGYQGDFADAIYQRFGCRVIVFEPVPAFSSHLMQRFSDNKSIRVIDCGLGSEDRVLPMKLADDGSSFFGGGTHAAACVVVGRLRKADTVLSELALDTIDLMKINIEGGEYELLQVLIDSGWIGRVRYLQVQFHNFVPDAALRRAALREQLARTHREMWCYEFVWESWELRK